MADILTGTLSRPATMSGRLSSSPSTYPPYVGEYEVEPSDVVQTLKTAGKVLSKDIIINPISYQETENQSHGLTAIIGKEVVNHG